MPYKDLEKRREFKKLYLRKYRLLNKEKCRQYSQKSYLKHKQKTILRNKKYEKYKLNIDINFKLRKNLRCRLKQALKNNYKSGSAIKDLGCSIEKFKLWVELHWREGMTWDNYGKWHLDHIKPLSKFDLTNREEFLKACHFSNIQPLWAEDNLRKSDIYE